MDGRGVTRERELAEQAIDPDVTSAAVVAAFWECLDGGIDPQLGYEAMRAHVSQARKNVQASAEATLLGQAAALNAIFADMARRAQAHLGQRGRAAERYLRLAMRAQNQCRATLNALTTLASRPSEVAEQHAPIRRIERRIYVEHRPDKIPVLAEQAPCPATDAANGDAGTETGAEGAMDGNRWEDMAYGAGLDGGAAGRLFADDARPQAVGALDRPAYG
jgi:hypothetical protein